MANALILLQLGLQFTARLQEIQRLQQTAALEGRDVTDEEVAAFAAQAELSGLALDAAIATAKAEGR